ncbi:MAG: hypothetical protein KGJ49_05010 [Alphaproteobacteria bacterium]|nr:hypothetical protein [Alphaproteobacteria bacterium]
MIDSHDPASFRSGWRPVGRSRDVALSFQRHLRDFVVTLDCLYYFKAISGFGVPLPDDEKFEAIDAFVVREFGCEYDDIITVNSEMFGPVIIMSETTLRRAGVKLPRWGEPPRQKTGQKPALTLVTS